MGGSALKNITTRRYQRDEYYTLEKEVIEKFQSTFPRNRVEAIKAYRSKDSFGDMDLLFETSPGNYDWGTMLELMFNPKQIVKNGSVWSFEYKDFQIDLILTSPDEFDTSVFYFAFNDLQNLTGRVYHKMGFKFGHRGLSFVLKDGDYQFSEILLSDNPRKIYEFAQYDFTRYQHDFNDLLDIFDFVASSPYFNKDIYLLHNRNHTSRVRDKKRKTYSAFLDWCEEQDEFKHEYPWVSMEERGGRKEVEIFMQRAFEMFPDFKAQYVMTMFKFERHRQFKELYNGDLVRKWTGLENQELGKFMKMVKEYVRVPSSFEDWVIENPDKIESSVTNLFGEFVND